MTYRCHICGCEMADDAKADLGGAHETREGCVEALKDKHTDEVDAIHRRLLKACEERDEEHDRAHQFLCDKADILILMAKHELAAKAARKRLSVLVQLLRALGEWADPGEVGE